MGDVVHIRSGDVMVATGDEYPHVSKRIDAAYRVAKDMSLPASQSALLVHVAAYDAGSGVAVSYEGCAAAMGFGASTLRRATRALADLGLVRLTPNLLGSPTLRFTAPIPVWNLAAADVDPARATAW